MAGGIRRALLVVAVMVAVVGAHVGWVRTAAQIFERTEPPATDSGGEDEAKAEAEKEYHSKNRPPRSGSTVLTIAPGTGADAGQWHATAKHTVTLRPGDPMIEDLREGRQNLADWLPVLLSVGQDGCAWSAFDTQPDDDRLVQTGPRSPVRAGGFEEVSWRGDDYNCVRGHTVVSLTVNDGRLGAGGIYDRWTVRVKTRDRILIGIDGGDTLSQSAHGAELLVPDRGEPIILELGGPDFPGEVGRGDTALLVRALQQPRSPSWEIGGLAAALVALTRWWVLPFVRDWAPSATRRRWTAVAVAGCGVTGALLLLGSTEGSASLPLRLSWPSYPVLGSLLVVWWWVLLPFLLAVFALRVIEGRTPRAEELLPLVVPSAVLVVPVGMVAAAGWTVLPLLLVAFMAAVPAGIFWALYRGWWGRTGERWAVVAAAGVWLSLVAAGPGTGLPIDTLGRSPDAWPLVNSLVLAALNWGWVAALWMVLTAFEARRWLVWTAAVGLGGGTVNGALRNDWSYSWNSWADGEDMLVMGVRAITAANWPLWALELVVLAGVATYLRIYGEDDGWPPHVRTAALALGVSAAGTGMTLYGFVTFGSDWQRTGYYLAVAIAAVGFSWLLPATAEDRAVRLHNTRPATHNRMMHALLKDQTLAAGRREFLTASRSALAAGELTARQWSARWRGLGALGPRGTAPQHSVGLRLAALGTSGGRSALRNGTAAAVLLAVLGLPWLAYSVPPLLGETEDMGDVQVWMYGLRWPLYGFLYGYAYSWLRGGSPVGKALCLLAVVLPTELAQLLYRGLGPADFAVSLLLATGNCLALFLVLGLYWEARLVRAAGLRWGQIRNFRSLSATAVPATTVLVAAATALATAMVGMWVTPENGPTPSTLDDSPSVSAEATPGH
ncbi:hypothetical protein [Streptomyces canus]|uniref:hypothetical protein n=1 Tax=Streptomyces canus TaxID=58343 RepID=UPI002E328E83|nr:hypothetical protein [Streptomyces canus]